MSLSLKKNIIFNFLGSFWGNVIGIIFIPLYLKFISADGYGLISVFASLQVVLSLLDGGLSTTVNRELARLSVIPGNESTIKNFVKTLGNIYWCISLIVGIIGIILSPFMAHYWVHSNTINTTIIQDCFMLLSFSLVFQFAFGFYTGALLGLQQHVTLNIIRIVFSTVKYGGALIILAFISNSLSLFFLWYVIVSIIQTMTIRWFVWHYVPRSPLKPVFDKNIVQNIWRYAAGITSVSFVVVLLTQIDKVILSKILPLHQFAYYSMAATAGTALLSFTSPLIQSYFPKISSLFSLQKFNALANAYHQQSQLLSIITMPIAFCVIIFSKQLLMIWLKDAAIVEQTWLMTSIFAAGSALNAMINAPQYLAMAVGRVSLIFKINLGLLIIMVPTIILSASYWGGIGGAFCWLILNTLFMLFYPLVIHKNISYIDSKRWYLIDFLLPLIIALIVFSIIRYFYPVQYFHNSVIEMTVLCFIFAFVLLLTSLISKQVRDIINQFFRKFLRKQNI